MTTSLTSIESDQMDKHSPVKASSQISLALKAVVVMVTSQGNSKLRVHSMHLNRDKKMKHTYHIKMRAALWIMLGVACFVSTTALAGEPAWWTQQKRDCNLPSGLAYNNWDGQCNSSPGNSTSAPSYNYEAVRRAQEAEATAATERQRQQAEAAKRAAEKKRQEEADFIRGRDSAASSLKGSSGSEINQLKGLSDADSSGLKGSGFDSGSSGLKGLKDSVNDAQKSRSKPAPHTDTSVVDARVPRDGAYLTAQVPDLQNSPATDRITKGFQAVIKHDWPVALAWFQDALNRDPNNAALKRSVDLAQWMVARRKAKAAGPATPLTAAIYSASHGNSAEAIRQFELVKKENPAIAPQVDNMINTLRQRQKKDTNETKLAADREAFKKANQRIVDAIFERGMNHLSIGDEKGAQEAFDDADDFGGYYKVQPSQLPGPKSAKRK